MSRVVRRTAVARGMGLSLHGLRDTGAGPAHHSRVLVVFSGHTGATSAGTLASAVRVHLWVPFREVSQPLGSPCSHVAALPEPAQRQAPPESPLVPGLGLLTLSAVVRVSGSVPQSRASGELAVDTGHVWKGVASLWL